MAFFALSMTLKALRKLTVKLMLIDGKNKEDQKKLTVIDSKNS
jgi:hypothetical protein